jgi:hypothetical protein
MTNCTIVLLSWSRPGNIDKIITTYHHYGCVEEIIIWNNNPAVCIHNTLPKVKVINGNQDLGLNTRFAAALMSQNRCVIVHDDDLMLSENNIIGLIKGFETDYTRIYTYEGRNLIGGAYNYSGQCRIEKVLEPTEADVALTRATCFDKLLASEYFKLSDVLFYDVSICLNGEDILLSYISKNVHGKKPLVLPLADDGYVELPAKVDEKISTRPGFLEERNKIVQRCELILPTPGYPPHKNSIFGAGFYPFGYFDNSTCYNSPFTKLLVKKDSGINYLSQQSSPDHDFMVGTIVLNNPVWITKHLSLSLFFKNAAAPLKIQLGCIYGDQVETKSIQLEPLGLNQTNQILISLDDLKIQHGFALTDIKFVISNKRQNLELCIVNLSYDD